LKTFEGTSNTQVQTAVNELHSESNMYTLMTSSACAKLPLSNTSS